MDAWIDALGIALVPYLLLVGASGLLSMYYLGRTVEHIREEKRWTMFVPPAWFFFRDCLDDQGNYYRVRAGWTTGTFCLAVIIGWLVVY